MKSFLLTLGIVLVGIASAIAQSSLERSSADDFYSLTSAASAALDSGDAQRAKNLANELLAVAPDWKKDWNYGNAIHTANVVLGRIALAEGDKESARAYLLAAGETPGSPQLDSFGPDMLFAREMLEAGEHDVVLKYFDLCSVFWKKHESRLESWRSSVEEGVMPDFGPNLRYIFSETVQAAR